MFKIDDVYHSEPLADTTLFYRTSYLVIPRSVAFAMPYDWQQRFAALMEEARDIESEAVPGGLPWPDEYAVQPRDDTGKFTSDPLADYRNTCDAVDNLRDFVRAQPVDAAWWRARLERRECEVRLAIAMSKAADSATP